MDCYTVVDMVGVERSGKRFKLVNDDPQIIYKFRKPLKPGWYVVTFNITGENLYQPKLYLDQGAGFAECHSIVLEPSKENGVWKASFYLAADTNLIRFDPSEIASDLIITKMIIKRLGVFGTGLMLAVHTIRIARIDPIRLVLRCQNYLRFLNDPQFKQVHPPVEGGGESYERWMKQNMIYNSKIYRIQRNAKSARS